MHRFTSWILIALVTLALPTISISGDADFDRLDGKGPSGKRVDVIEWEGNFEIHVYPKGSLAGLALKLDDRSKDKLVMVIGYRFNNSPKKQLIRRAIIGIPFTAKFFTFRDSKEPEFDKIVISNNTLSGDLAQYKLDPEPTQLYPEDPSKDTKKVAEKAVPPQTGTAPQEINTETNPRQRTTASTPDEEGSIKPFKW